MKNFLLLIIISALFACTKSDSISISEQKGRKQKSVELSVALETSFPVGEDAIVSIDSAKWVVENVGTGNNIYWSVRGDESILPSISGAWVEVWIEEGFTDKFGQTSTTSHWTTVGQDYYASYSPGKAGVIFDGYPGQVETRIYRAGFIDKNGVAHHSSAFQIN